MYHTKLWYFKTHFGRICVTPKPPKQVGKTQASRQKCPWPYRCKRNFHLARRQLWIRRCIHVPCKELTLRNLKIGPNAPKGRVHLPSINFQVLLLLVPWRAIGYDFRDLITLRKRKLRDCNRNKENNFLWWVVSNVSNPLLQLRIYESRRTAQISMSWKHHLLQLLGKMLGSFWITCHCEWYPKMARIFSLLHFRNMAWGSPHVRKLQYTYSIQFQAQPSANKTT